MNVYVRSLASALAGAGVECDVFTRADHAEQAPVVDLEPGVRVIHLDAGPHRPVAKAALPALVDDLVAGARARFGTTEYDAIHAHYWISGAVGHVLKHELDLPLVTTFHTLAHVKAAAGLDDDPRERAHVEGEVVRCSDRIVASTAEERAELVAAYGADPERVEVIPPGVDHSIFSPAGWVDGASAVSSGEPAEPDSPADRSGDRDGARRRVGLAVGVPLLLFVGRIQPLKGVDLALRCLAALDGDVTLAVVGGPSGADGPAEVDRLHALARDLGVADRVHWVDPQPHAALADWYRAADVCIVPSRTESFGLVALEAAACGTPVVAADVGGLRSLVDHEHTGFLVEGRTALAYAEPVRRLLDDPGLAAEMAVSAAARSRRYTWSMTAARLRRLYADVGARELLRCT